MTLIQPVESFIVGPNGKPLRVIAQKVQPMVWTVEAWAEQLRRHGYEDDLARMERAQLKRERKNAKRRSN